MIAETQQRPKGTVCKIAFSGFSDRLGPGMDSKALAHQIGLARRLNVEVIEDGVLDSTVTHLVFPKKPQIANVNLKLLLAILTGKYIVLPTWLRESMKAGFVLPAEQHGKRSHSSPFDGKKVFASQDFLSDNPRCQKNVLQMMIEKVWV